MKAGMLDADATAEKIAAWSREFFGDPKLESDGHCHIATDVPDFHKSIYHDLMSNYRLYYITAPSEFAKTTICTLIYPLYQIVYFHEPYTVLSGRVDDTSVGFLDLMKDEITDNQKFISVYGRLRDQTNKLTWNDHHMELTCGSRVSAIAVGGNVRSRRKGQYRITLFIIDDPEELQDLDSNVTLKRNHKWVGRTVEKRLDRRFGKLRVVGTYIGRGCTIEKVMNDSRWKGRKYVALVKDENTGKEHSIWEDVWSTQFLINERAEAIANNEFEDWMFERQNEPLDDYQKNLKGYKFHELEHRRVNDQNTLFHPKFAQNQPIAVNNYIAIDPAYAMDSQTADQRALIVYSLGQQLIPNEYTGELYPLNCCWILEYTYNFMDPADIIDEIFRYHKRYYFNGVIIEAIGPALIYESLMQRRLQSDPFFFKYPFNPIIVKSQPPNKLRRVYEGLKPRVKMGQLFCRDTHVELIKEMEIFDEKQLHLLDALEMGLRHSTTASEPLRKVSRERENLAKRSFKRMHQEIKKRQGKFVTNNNPIIPSSLNQVMRRSNARW